MNDKTIQDSIKLLKLCLSNPWGRTRAPRGFEAALNKARSESSSTESIFLGVSFQAWAAYYLTSIESNQHKKGQAAASKTIAHLGELDVQSKQQVAMALAETNPHPTTKVALERCLNTKRRRGSLIRPTSFCPLISI